MRPLKRSYIRKTTTSLTGVICFFLFAVQLNGQYFLPADPSADAKDPVSIIARVVSSSSLFGSEHLPVYKEETTIPLCQVRVHYIFHNADQALLLADRMLPSLRGPPAAFA